MSTKRRKPITAAEAGRRAWRGTTKAQRSEIMRARYLARWRCPTCRKGRSAHQWDGERLACPEVPSKENHL